MLRAAIRPARRVAFARAVHTARPVAGPSRVLAWAPTVAVTALGVGIFGWQLGRSGAIVSLDAGEPAPSEPPLSTEQAAADLLHAKAEEAEESVEEATAESDKDAAFDPVTGEINWDCPCLGGMAHGPCGEEFKAAFSCFVYSNEEPKGVDCVEKFRGMQDCFRAHPDVYGEELMDDGEQPEDELADAPAPALATDSAEPAAPQRPAPVLTEPQVVFVPDDAPPEGVPSQPKTYPPASSPVLGTNSDTPSKRF